MAENPQPVMAGDLYAEVGMSICLSLPCKWDYHFLLCNDMKTLGRTILTGIIGLLNILESLNRVQA